MVGIYPYWITDISWQLSVLATAALVFPLFKFNSGFIFNSVIWKHLIESIYTSLIVSIWVLPILLWHFGKAQLISVVSTPLIGWLVSPITILGLIVSIGLSLGINWILVPLFLCLETVVFIFVHIIELISKFNVQLNLEITFPLVATCYVLLIILILLKRKYG